MLCTLFRKVLFTELVLVLLHKIPFRNGGEKLKLEVSISSGDPMNIDITINF